MDTFNNLSTPVKAGVALASGAGLMGMIALLTGGNTTVLLIVAMGIVLVGMLLVGYKFVLGWLRKRKAAPLERGILNNSAASPNSISEPARRARLDDLRRSFEGGVEKFRASGKNIYSLPWYVLVGEPGSGKTEAIRHCNVGFPPGLQDQLQGAGGTLNMNWWFTNHAIILDTAGRLMFEEVEPGATSEWKEFLGMLLRGRPNCPINGLMLVIPADSLIRDTADSIERKAGKIAQQLDSIQRQLGVRFPVFVVITKSDLINGFREFFDTLTDPQLQHQIMGWSNPSPLDQPFSPDLVERHLETVAASLAKRRQGLLIDPVNTEDPNARRVDQVDALYAFPESLLKIGPRLRRYLEMVFVAGEWSPKPLFLRGIYFTSSMREGSALDAELAEALKVPIESLPEGKVWERDRAYFLRDLFIQKVFKEKGLVTRASDTKKLQRHRKMAVMVTGFIGVFVLLGLTWFGARTLDKSIDDQKKYWSAASSEYLDSPDKWQIVDTKSTPAKYLGDAEIRAASGKIPRVKFHSDTYDMLQRRIDVPWIFKPLAAFSGDVNEKRSTAYRSMFETSVLRPLIEGARAKIRAEKPETWSDRATMALGQLIRIETYAAKSTPNKAEEARISIDPLARYVLEDADYNAFRQKHGAALQGSAEWLYTNQAGSGVWPPAGFTGGLPTVTTGVNTFVESWARQFEGRSARLKSVRALVESLDKFRRAETDVRENVTRNTADKFDQYTNFSGIWTDRFGIMKQAKLDADKNVESLEKDNGWPATTSLAAVFDAEVDRIVGESKTAYQALINHLPPDDKAKATPLAGVQGTLKDALLTKVPNLDTTARAGDLRKKTIPELDQFYLARGQDLDKKQSRRYAIHFQVYDRANQQMTPVAPPANLSFASIAGELKKVDSEMDARVVKDVEALPSGFTVDPETITKACATAIAVAEIAAKERRYKLIMTTLDSAPKLGSQVGPEIAKGAASREPIPYRKVPLTALNNEGKFRPEYHPDAASDYVSGWKAMGNQLAEAKTKPRSGVLNAQELSDAFEKTNKPIVDYLREYIGYWTNDLRDSLKVASFTSWKTIFTDDLRGGQWEGKALENVQDMDDKSQKAIEKIRPFLTPQLVQSINQPAPMTERESARLTERARLVVTRWRALGDDAEQARRAVLDIPQADFESTYIFPDDEKARLAERYVAQFTFKMLEALANEARKTASDSLAKLRQLGRFPLARPEKGVPSLTEEDVEKARILFSRIKMGDANVAGAVRPVAVAREAGGVDALLRMLRGLDLNREDAIFIERTGLVLKALPEKDKPLTCTISFLPADEQKNKAGRLNKKVPFEAYSYGELVQGKTARERQLGNIDKDIKPLGDAVCPGDPVRLRFSALPTPALNDRPYVWPPVDDKEYDASSPWTLLRLLHGDNVNRLDDGKTWHVEVPVDSTSSFWIELRFDTKLPGYFPKSTEWPEKQAPAIR